jgi:5-methylcytosine-specific restriction enzyme A
VPQKPAPFRLTPKPPSIAPPRLTRQQRGYTEHWYKVIRPRVLRRDAYLCQECKRNGKLTPVGKGKNAHVDHIIPKSQGGTDDDSNLRTLCASCHSRATVKHDGGFGRPITPKRT